jgi:hypothetical protein
MRRKHGSVAGGPAKSFRVPRGKVAITIKVHDENSTTVMFDADAVADIVRIIDQTAGRPPYDDVVHGLAAAFVSCKRTGADLTSIGAGVMWTAFHHPQIGAGMWDAVSREVRYKGKAHITWRLSEKGFALALADTFIDLDAALSEARPDTLEVVDRRPDDGFKPN